MTHILACALACNPDGTDTGLTTFTAWAVIVVLAIGVVIWVIRKAVEGGRQMTGRRR